MIAPISTTSTSFVATYDRSGKSSLSLRSEPAQYSTVAPDHGGTSSEKYKDTVTLSANGVEKSRNGETTAINGSSSDTVSDAEATQRANTQKQGKLELTPAEQKVVEKLKARDQQVKTHEMAHLASAGQYAKGGASYSYEFGPDGQRYAIGGEVPIDLSKGKTPEETMQKMEAIKRAALAPADPSSADRAVASTATALENQARQELQRNQAASRNTSSGNNSFPPSTGSKQEANVSAGTSTPQRLAEDIFT